MALAAGESDCGVVTDHMRGDLGHRFALGRINFARHDRGPGFVFGQEKLVEPAARARAEQPDVVGDLEEGCGCCLESA